MCKVQSCWLLSSVSFHDIFRRVIIIIVFFNYSGVSSVLKAAISLTIASQVSLSRSPELGASRPKHQRLYLSLALFSNLQSFHTSALRVRETKATSLRPPERGASRQKDQRRRLQGAMKQKFCVQSKSGIF
jgi:hypothetical protein